MKKYSNSLIALITILLIYYFPSNAEENKTKKIISLSPSATEQIFVLGRGDDLVACSEYCIHPPQAQNKEKIGSLLSVNIEKILTLNPDIIVTSYHTKPIIIEKLKSFGFEILIQNTPSNFDEFYMQFIELAEKINEKKRAIEITKSAKNKLIKISNLLSPLKQKPKALIQIGVKPIYLAGDELFVSDFIKYSGATNLLKNKRSGTYSREFIISEKPDFIFIVISGAMAEEEKRQWEKFDSIPAVQNSRVYTLDSYQICSPNPIKLPDTVAKIAKILHPDKIEEINKLVNDESN
ncbi:MAG TPA: helical backbone metal receptor [Victivallales bacterium]|nr:helical backbone metal receptor [Victivallales bacterium]HRR05904.1 helical backbone metal receptor [Victivallales bacterium]HRU00633.1 helical backbone metal receptor [Victivallales bacterium]